MRFKGYQSYVWVYIIGTVLTLINGLIFQNTYLSIFSLVMLYGILFYKGLHILMCYKKTEHRYQRVQREAFAQKYRTFRIRVALFWLAFVALCIIGKFVLQMDKLYFYSCTFFFLVLDRLFVNVGCLLRKFSDLKGKTVLCCCGCPCRGWDLMMIHTPLLFALHRQDMVENVLICLSTVLAICSLIAWERGKYALVEVRNKCAKSCNLDLCREHLPTVRS